MKTNRFNILFLLASFLVFSLIISPVSAESEPVNISKSNSKSFQPQIVIDNENLYAVWTDESPGNRDIFFSKSNDGGKSFSIPVNLSNNSGNSIFPRISISENNVFVTWYDYTPCKSDIFFAKSLNGGETFDTINLSSSPGVSYNPWVASVGEKVYVVWNDSTLPDGSLPPGESVCQEGFDSTQHQDIFVAVSEDAGLTFDILKITDTLFAWNPRIATIDESIFLIWNQQKLTGTTDIFFAKSIDGGKSFDEPKSISNSDNRSEDGAIKAYGNDIYLIWKEIMPKKSDIYFSKSLNKGESFLSPINLSNDPKKSVIARDTQLKIHENNIYIVWYEQPPNSSGVYFVKSSDAGEGFSQKIKLDGNSSSSEFAQIDIHDQNISVIWEDKKFGKSQVFLRQSHDGGDSFSNIKSLSGSQLETRISILGPQLASTDDKTFFLIEKLESGQSDLFLDYIEHTLDPDFMMLETSNDLLQIELDFGGIDLDIKEPAIFALRFIDAESGKQIENIQYSFLIEDLDGQFIYADSQFSEDGEDSQSVHFSQTGPLTVKITVDGQGIENPLDSKYNGDTSAVITVIPEFPLGTIGILSIVLASSILLRKIKAF